MYNHAIILCVLTCFKLTKELSFLSFLNKLLVSEDFLFVQDCQSHNSLVKSPSSGSFVSIGSSSASSSLSSAISQELQRRTKVKNMKLFINKVLPT